VIGLILNEAAVMRRLPGSMLAMPTLLKAEIPDFEATF
jgi:hypothetical protein